MTEPVNDNFNELGAKAGKDDCKEDFIHVYLYLFFTLFVRKDGLVYIVCFFGGFLDGLFVLFNS